jgi:hypothetical protein
MKSFQKLDTASKPTLKIIRKGWFKTRYILTDDQFEYGTLGCAGGGFFSRDKKIETSEGNFIIKPVGFFAKQTQIIDSSRDELIGTYTRNTWDSKNSISLTSGLNADLLREGGIFSRKMVWNNDQLGKFMQLKSCAGFSKVFTITFDPGVINKNLPLALLSLVGANIILLRQAQAAAAIN